jgi:hypothetical protein
MLRQERENDLNTALLLALRGWQSGMWTAMPGFITGYNPAENTVTVQPSIRGQVRDKHGVLSWVNMPLLIHVPVVFPSGGGFVLTFPIAAGDECLVVFASRCIDAWWQSGGIGNQIELRMHDLSDGFAIPGPYSKPRVPEAISTEATQLRSLDGETYVQVGPDGVVRVQAEDIESHAKHSYVWDVNGYGQKITHTGGNAYTIDNYVTGAVITTNNLPINPPDAT